MVRINRRVQESTKCIVLLQDVEYDRKENGRMKLTCPRRVAQNLPSLSKILIELSQLAVASHDCQPRPYFATA